MYIHIYIYLFIYVYQTLNPKPFNPKPCTQRRLTVTALPLVAKLPGERLKEGPLGAKLSEGGFRV